MRTKGTRRKIASKQGLISRGRGIPPSSEGREGNLSVRTVRGSGVHLAYKFGSKWYYTKMDNKLREDSVILQKSKKPRVPGELSISRGSLYVKRKSNEEAKEILTNNSQAKIKALSLTLDDNRVITSSDGAVIHVDAHEVQDNYTATGDIVSTFAHMKLEAPTLSASSAGVKTTSAATLYIEGGPSAGTNQTITNSYDLYFGGSSGNIGSIGDLDINATVVQLSAGLSLPYVLFASTLGSESRFTMYERGGTTDEDYMRLAVGEHGVTTLYTIDDAASNANLIFNVDGLIDLNTTSSGLLAGVRIQDSGTTYASFSVHHSASYLTIYENGGASFDDYCAIDVAPYGATTITTVDAAASVANFTLDIDGSITLDSNTGKFITKNADTEFSVAGSAYAGMILGYTTLGIDAVPGLYTLTATMVAIHDSLKVKFVAPPSGVVEIFAQIYFDASRRVPVLGLSDQDNATGYQAISFPNTTDETNEHIQALPPSSAGDSILRPHWVVTGLTPGTAYEWWIGAKTTTGTGGVLRWGGTATNQYPPFIMKATALPAATADFAAYG